MPGVLRIRNSAVTRVRDWDLPYRESRQPRLACPLARHVTYSSSSYYSNPHEHARDPPRLHGTGFEPKPGRLSTRERCHSCCYEVSGSGARWNLLSAVCTAESKQARRSHVEARIVPDPRRARTHGNELEIILREYLKGSQLALPLGLGVADPHGPNHCSSQFLE